MPGAGANKRGEAPIRFCSDCFCPQWHYGTCHCDHDIYGPDCFKRGRHEASA